MQVACVLKTGGAYGPRHVAQLREGIRRHSPRARFVCLTDAPDSVEADEIIPLQHNWPGWWAKIELFRHVKHALYLDLGTVVLAPVEEWERDRLTLTTDFLGYGAQSCMMWVGDDWDVYDGFCEAPIRFMRQFSPCNGMPWGDQGFVASTKDVALYADPGLLSWKVHCRDGVPEGAKMVFFHGLPRCHDVHMEAA